MKPADAQKMWGGRFERAPDASFYEFERSWHFDRRMLPQELALDRAWARAITAAGILTPEEGQRLIAALDEIEKRAQTDAAWLDASNAEDVHHFAETALIEKLGPLGAKLHTGRSRNEMVATEFRMYVKDAARELRRALGLLTRAFAEQAKRSLGIPMPGTTHMQHAQPLLLSHWLLAHGEAFQRDADRLAGVATSADSCPLGSGALAGCAFPLDRNALARDLGFSRITPNSLDAVSDRDFALEALFAFATLAMHLSRLAEDMILFASPEFAFIELPDEYSTGSSLMPQKKNPDSWELIRGKTGRVYGSLFALLTTCKGLPSSYQRDLQEDKEPLFAAYDQVLGTVRIAAATLAATKFREARLREAAQDPGLVATELADYLVAQAVPFRDAHEIVGKVLRAAEQEGKSIRELPLERLKQFSPAFTQDLGAVLTVESALARKSAPGGTAPSAVRDALEAFTARVTKTRAKPMNAPLSASDVPQGFTFSAVHCGLKHARLDLGILISETPAAAAAVFTTNQIAAAPVLASRAHLKQSRAKMRGLIVNSGNANCCTRADGYPASIATASKLAEKLGDSDPSQFLVCSTGVIGAPLKVEKILDAVPQLVRERRSEARAFEEFARAIMTTDTRPKWATAKCRIGGKQVRLLGCAKGSGMIQPNLATMLGFIVTDAAVAPPVLSRALKAAVGPTFNSITVDGDTSTNDTVALFANGQSGAQRLAKATGADYKSFFAALLRVCQSLALAIVQDGEGAQRVVEIEVRGAPSDRAADRVARTIANSPLVKTAVAGADPNWGRILAAAGRSGVRFNRDRANIWIGGISVCRGGREYPFDETAAHQKMLATHVPIRVDLHSGKGSARIWTCDFTVEYVHINSSYRT